MRPGPSSSAPTYAGDFGVSSATPTASRVLPGARLYSLLRQVVDQDGNTLITLNPDKRGDLNVHAYAVAAWWVTDKKIWGGKLQLAVSAGLCVRQT